MCRYLLCASFALFVFAIAASVDAANIAPAANPVGSSSAINNITVLNDGNTTDAVGNSSFIIPPTGKQGIGFDLGGVATVDTIDLIQHSQPTRNRIASVNVYTSQGVQTITGLPNTDSISLNLGGIPTSFVFVVPLTQHAGTDTQIGLREVQVNSTVGVTSARTNYAASAVSVTEFGAGWNSGATANLNNNVLRFGPSIQDASTSRYNSSVGTAPNLVFDLGQAREVGTLGLVQQTHGGGGDRQMIRQAKLDFANNSAFTGTITSRTVNLDNNGVYQQLNFAPATGRYVRFTPVGQYAGADSNIGFSEVQLYSPATQAVDLQFRNTIGGSYNFASSGKIIDGDLTGFSGASFIGGTFPPTLGTDGGQFGAEFQGSNRVTSFAITQEASGARHRLQDITVYTSPTQSYNFTLADTYNRQVINFPAPVDTRYLLVQVKSQYTAGSGDANSGILEFEAFGTPLTQTTNVNAGIVPVASTLLFAGTEARLTDGVVDNSNPAYFVRNAGQDSITVNYAQRTTIGAIGLGFDVDSTPIGIRDLPRSVRLEYEYGAYDITLAGDLIDYAQYDLPFPITTNFLRLVLPDGSVAGNWFLHNDVNYGITEFEAFSGVQAPEPGPMAVWSLVAGIAGLWCWRGRKHARDRKVA